jgi:hypothetical protein
VRTPAGSSHRCQASLSEEGPGGVVAVTVFADLGEQGAGGDDSNPGEAGEDLGVRVLARVRFRALSQSRAGG